MHATKVKELWRDSSGHFAKAPEPIEIPKVETKKEDGNVIIALVMLGIGALAILFIVWQITISIAGVAAIRYGYLKYQEYRSQNPLVVNYYV